jgi:hypothetical protein
VLDTQVVLDYYETLPELFKQVKEVEVKKEPGTSSGKAKSKFAARRAAAHRVVDDSDSDDDAPAPLHKGAFAHTRPPIVTTTPVNPPTDHQPWSQPL